MQDELIEIEKRKSIWIALSEFYLDTELSEEDFKHIATVFIDSGLDIKSIKEIDLYEVFPVLQPNLLSVAGEWAGFNGEWLFENCERSYKKRNKGFHRMKNRFWNKFFYWMRRDSWEKVEEQFRKKSAQGI